MAAAICERPAFCTQVFHVAPQHHGGVQQTGDAGGLVGLAHRDSPSSIRAGTVGSPGNQRRAAQSET